MKQRWKYNIIAKPANELPELARELAEAGEDGWELVQVTESNIEGCAIYLAWLKRPHDWGW